MAKKKDNETDDANFDPGYADREPGGPAPDIAGGKGEFPTVKTIIVNEVEREVQADNLTYNELKKIAFPHQENILVGISYRFEGEDEQVADKSLTMNNSVMIQDGMVFKVIDTRPVALA